MAETAYRSNKIISKQGKSVMLDFLQIVVIYANKQILPDFEFVSR